MKIEVGTIKPNPFKKFINAGKLNEPIVEKLIEGYKQTKFHENLCGRKNNKGEIELIYGHHRLEAVKRVYGKKHIITMQVYDEKDFSDQSMLIDMVRENLTQRDTDYRDFADSCLLTKKWLGSGSMSVKELYRHKGLKGFQKGIPNTSHGIGSRQIAKFLSNQGKAVSHMQISKVLNIEENLSPEIRDKVVKGVQGHTEDGKIGLELGAKIASFEDKKEQKKIIKVIKNIDLSEEKTIQLLTQYKEAPKEIKEKVRMGEIKLTKINNVIMIKELTQQDKDRIKKKVDLEEISKKLIREGYSLDSTIHRFREKLIMLRNFEVDKGVSVNVFNLFKKPQKVRIKKMMDLLIRTIKEYQEDLEKSKVEVI